MKKITSAILALTMLFTLCACQNEPEGNETSVQSEAESTPIISIDPGSMFSSDAPSSDVPSNEGSKPDENVSSEENTSSDILSEISSEERIPEDPPPAQIEEEIEIEEERIAELLNNPGVAIGDNLYILEWHEAIYPENCYYLFYRYDLVAKKMYLRSVISEYSDGKPVPSVRGNVTIQCKTSEAGDKCIFVELFDEYYDSDMFFLDFEEGRILEYDEYKPFTAEGEKEPIVIPTDDEDPEIGDESFEVPATHPEYGNMVIDSAAMVIPGTNKAIIAYRKNETVSAVVIYDYDTNMFEDLTDIDGSVYGIRCYGDGYVFIDAWPSDSEAEGHDWQTLYVYSLATGRINKVPVRPSDGWDTLGITKGGCSNGIIFWREHTWGKIDGGYNIKDIVYAYDVENDVKHEIFRYDVTTQNFYNSIKGKYIKSGAFVEYDKDDGTTTLCYASIEETVCITENVICYHVCENQGYVMYYEEQADGSFEWKYYNFK